MIDIKEFLRDYFKDNPKPTSFSLQLPAIFRNNKELRDALIELTNFLDEDVKVMQRIWHFYHGTYYRPRCKICNKENTKFVKFSRGYEIFCKDCRKEGWSLTQKEFWENMTDDEREEYTIQIFSSQKKTLAKLYGDNVVNVSQTQKYKDTCSERYGIEHPWKQGEIRDKMLLKSQQTCLEKYGVDHNWKAECVKEQARQTCLEKYGAPYYRGSDTNQKKQHQTKILELESGKQYYYQGYSGFAIEYLLQFYDEDDILSEFDCPKIEFETFGKKKTYRPDIYIPKQNLIIEVKCEYTFTYKPIITIQKLAATHNARFEVQVFIIVKHSEDKFDVEVLDYQDAIMKLLELL